MIGSLFAEETLGFGWTITGLVVVGEELGFGCLTTGSKVEIVGVVVSTGMAGGAGEGDADADAAGEEGGSFVGDCSVKAVIGWAGAAVVLGSPAP